MSIEAKPSDTRQDLMVEILQELYMLQQKMGESIIHVDPSSCTTERE